MTEQPKVYELAPTTHNRSPDYLARKHGFLNVNQLAELLPMDARVIDVGAGDSRLGEEVAAVRPDITWINLDYSYSDTEAVERLKKSAPPNLEFVQGDATKLDEMFDPDSFDAVFSYWLMPHMSLDDYKPAQLAAKNMLNIAKVGGFLSVGPGNFKQYSRKEGPAIRVTKKLNSNPDSYASEIVSRTKLTGLSRLAHKITNEVVTPYLGTSRFARHEQNKRLPLIYDQETGGYISPGSKKGIRIAGGLAVSATRHLSKQRKI